MILSDFEASHASMRFRQTLTRCTASSVETVTRVLPEMPQAAYADGQLVTEQGHSIPFCGSGPLLKIKQDHASLKAKTHPVLMLRSAGQALLRLGASRSDP